MLKGVERIMFPMDVDIREKILNTHGNIVVSANAGTGKTHITVKRIIQDVNSVTNYQTFAAITFTRKAAKEIKDRLGLHKSSGFIGTNDNFVLTEIIQPFMFDAYGQDFKKEIFPDYSNQNSISDFDEGINKIRVNGYICKFQDNHKNFSFQLGLEILKKSHSARRYLKSKYFRLYIDEYQDCDVDMHNLFMFICERLQIPLFIVGDVKQSIYGWRGAYSDGFKNLMTRKNFSTYTLWHNFRSNKVIQNYSNIFMDEARGNYSITEFDNEVQLIIYEEKNDAIDYIEKWLDKDRRCTFLNYRRDSAEEWSNLLRQKDIDFVYIPISPLDNGDLESEHIWIARVIASYLLEDRYSEYDVFLEIPLPEAFELKKIRSLLLNIKKHREDEEKFRIHCMDLYNYLGYNSTNEKINTEIGRLFNVVNNPRYIPYYNSSKYKLTTSTIHSSKGLEFEQVIITGNDYNFNNDNDRFLHYVAVSRPKDRLLILLENNYRGMKYLEEIENVVNKTKELGFKIECSDIVKIHKIVSNKEVVFNS
jgi:superfamily I DNA/RNA helicase